MGAESNFETRIDEIFCTYKQIKPLVVDIAERNKNRRIYRGSRLKNFILKFQKFVAQIIPVYLLGIDIHEKEISEIPINIHNEIRALNDHIARCYLDGVDDKKINKELDEAESHLFRLVFDCYKQLNVYSYDQVEAIEKKYYSDLWLYEDGGVFWQEYCRLRKDAITSVIDAKKKESISSDEAIKSYNYAYLRYYELIEMLGGKKHSGFLRKSYRRKLFNSASIAILWLSVTFFTAVVAVKIVSML